jgi:hypothetical protein
MFWTGKQHGKKHLKLKKHILTINNFKWRTVRTCPFLCGTHFCQPGMAQNSDTEARLKRKSDLFTNRSCPVPWMLMFYFWIIIIMNSIFWEAQIRELWRVYIYCESLTRFRHKSCTGPHWGEFSAPWLLAASSLVQRAMGCAAQIISLKTFDMTPARENTNFARWAWHAMHVTDIDGSSWSSTIWMCHLTLHVPAEKCWRIWVGWSISLLHNACSHLPYPPAGLKPVWYGMDSPIPWWQNVILNSLDFRGMLISKFESNDL